jgi:hypothetical protein
MKISYSHYYDIGCLTSIISPSSLQHRFYQQLNLYVAEMKIPCNASVIDNMQQE